MPVFEDATKPVVQRENEFRDVVTFLAANKDAVKSYTVTAQNLDDAHAQAEADKRKMAEAGNELAEKRTIRTRVEELSDGKSLKVYLWAAPKIQRKPKVKAAPAEVPAGKPAAKTAAK